MLPPKNKNIEKVALLIRIQIITNFLTNFNTLTEKIKIYGPNEIPKGHKLYGRKLLN